MKTIVTPLLIGVVGLFSLWMLIPDACACSTKEMAYRATARSDLRNLVTAQESFFDSARTYTADHRALNYSTSLGVTVAITLGDSSWSAVATHAAHGPGRCGIAVGGAANPVRPSPEGEPICEGFRRPPSRWKRLLGQPGRELP